MIEARPIPVCDKLDCINDPQFRVDIHLFSEWAEEPTVIHSNLWVCIFHQDDVRLEDLMDDAHWDMLCYAFASNGLSLPKRERTRIVFEPLLLLSSRNN